MDETKGRNSGSGSGSRSLAEKKENDKQGVRHHVDNLQLHTQSTRDVEMHRRSHDTDSRFLQHRDTYSERRRGSESRRISDRRSPDRRHESESRSLAEKRESVREHETGQIREQRDVEMQRRSHDTEPRFLQHKDRDTYSDRRGSESRRISYEGTRKRREDCRHYVKYGECNYISCRFNHPIHQRENCKFFVRGACKNGAACRFQHSMDSGDAEAMRQATSLDRRESESRDRLDERRHELESSSRPEKKARTIRDSRERDPRPRPDGINKIRLDQKRQEEERQMDIQRQRTEERIKRDQMRPTVTFN